MILAIAWQSSGESIGVDQDFFPPLPSAGIIQAGLDFSCDHPPAAPVTMYVVAGMSTVDCVVFPDIHGERILKSGATSYMRS